MFGFEARNPPGRQHVGIRIYNRSGRCLVVPPDWRLNLPAWTLQCGDKVVQLPPSLCDGEISDDEFEAIERALNAAAESP
ncbi:hypothetical protein [Achromobacter insuavis]|uniref:hypothetical protein n=1 Tax=Achromobacter insuavis TaxID=1287735 RepID=UPI001F13DF7F|nr:hypothetical protein [Achromobacter insuavis]